MITCPKCQKNEYVGTLFCSECGESLVSLEDGAVSRAFIKATGQVGGKLVAPPPPPAFPASINALVVLYLVTEQQFVPLAERESFTLGRINEGQMIIPDIDLSQYGAFEYGVSRLHASIQLGNPVTITDLGSVNGTRINGKKISPNVPRALTHGDVLALGKLRIQILIR
jgi:hypothetical protein